MITLKPEPWFASSPQGDNEVLVLALEGVIEQRTELESRLGAAQALARQQDELAGARLKALQARGPWVTNQS